MEHRVESIPNGKRIAMSGRLTFADHASFRNLIAVLEEPGMKSCVFDLSAVEFVDSAAMGMLLLARDKAVGRNVQITLKGAQGPVRSIMEVAKFGNLFTMEN